MSASIIHQQDIGDVHLILFNDYQEFGIILIDGDRHFAFNFRMEGDFWYLEDAFDVEGDFPTVGYLLNSHPLEAEAWILIDGYEYLREYISKIEHIPLFQRTISYPTLEKCSRVDIFSF